MTWLGFECSSCGNQTDRDTAVGLCTLCGGIRLARYDLDGLRGKLTHTELAGRSARIMRRFPELLPLENAGTLDRVWLGERETPLVAPERLRAATGLAQLSLKLDLLLPSGSLKDRPHTVTMAAALERGERTVAISSSGNGASAVAAHAARAGLQAVVGVFAEVPEAKLAKIRAYGPRILKLPGHMDGAETAIRDMSPGRGWFNTEAFVNPFNVEGEKSIGLEIAAQTDWDVPDVIVLPLGNGAAVFSPWKALCELHAIGLIDRVPRIVGVQFDACAPIARAFEAGEDRIRPFERKPSFSSTLMHEKPLSAGLALAAVRESGGMAIKVSDDEVRCAMSSLALHGGLFAEPAGAISLAGAMKLLRDGRISGSERIVCLVSGSGLNTPEAMPAQGTVEEISELAMSG
ncbi:threonine synthase [Pseudooceanicola sp. C21-150M6]|uniref:threonine synthase n=1 Tax=Pseudooceanicola sp. C21-150M6 TaxID=3434355 RepID=UPI003D7F9429